MNQIMNEVFTQYNKEALPETQKHFGRVYLCELPDKVKIGCTSNVQKRYSVLNREAIAFNGNPIIRFYCTEEHLNYYENEKKLHKYFESFRFKDTEFFTISVEEILAKLGHDNILVFDTDTNCEKHRSKFSDDPFINSIQSQIQAGLDNADMAIEELRRRDSFEYFLKGRFYEEDVKRHVSVEIWGKLLEICEYMLENHEFLYSKEGVCCLQALYCQVDMIYYRLMLNVKSFQQFDALYSDYATGMLNQDIFKLIDVQLDVFEGDFEKSIAR